MPCTPTPDRDAIFTSANIAANQCMTPSKSTVVDKCHKYSKNQLNAAAQCVSVGHAL